MSNGRRCVQCDKGLEGSQVKFCSRACDDRFKYLNNKRTTTCQFCKKEFKYSAKKVSNKPKYCSRECAAGASKERTASLMTPVAAPGLGQRFLELDNPIIKGHISEFIAQIYFSLRGWPIYKPAGDSGRVDYLVQTGDKILKVQVKTVYLNSHNKFEVRLSKSGKNSKLLLYTEEELDIVVAYSPIHNAIIEIPGNEAWGKHSLVFSRGEEGNYCGTSRFIEDYITLHL